VPVATRDLSLATARARIEDTCLRPSPPGIVGLETEWHVHCRGDARAIVPLETLRRLVDAAGPLPAASAVTYEPGGQLELSSRPAAGPGAAIDAMARDLAAVDATLAAGGIELAAGGVDAGRPPVRLLHAPRYDAMEAFFDADGPAGRLMMTRTASIQVNLGSGGEPTEQERRWSLAHALGPVLGAAFANSPLPSADAPMKSARMANWWRIDPTRTRPAWCPGDGRIAWADYALAARVMFVRSGDRFRPLCEPLPFGRWVTDGHELGHPTVEDLDYHLTTLFPPVRLRGWLELRYLDALPDPWWRVAAAVTTALLDDPGAGDRAWRAAAPTASCWAQAAEAGLRDPGLHRAARACFEAALDALERMDVDAATRDLCARYVDRFVGPGRCPAEEDRSCSTT
jgi:glutamate--cysteine ligase